MPAVNSGAGHPSSSVDPEAARYPGSSDENWAQKYRHHWLRRWERLGAPRQGERAWLQVKSRLKTMFNPRWLP